MRVWERKKGGDGGEVKGKEPILSGESSLQAGQASRCSAFLVGSSSQDLLLCGPRTDPAPLITAAQLAVNLCSSSRVTMGLLTASLINAVLCIQFGWMAISEKREKLFGERKVWASLLDKRKTTKMIAKEMTGWVSRVHRLLSNFFTELLAIVIGCQDTHTNTQSVNTLWITQEPFSECLLVQYDDFPLRKRSP
ncbi:hypothetical protein ILYODFUR_000114 [Ilyodon furcidens]|uniref:Uncharacterized protein n=1 Tax=Ilyodon furcidens TaxID=33524 RepID=A0ABV0UNW8_9TELE